MYIVVHPHAPALTAQKSGMLRGMVPRRSSCSTATKGALTVRPAGTAGRSHARALAAGAALWLVLAMPMAHARRQLGSSDDRDPDEIGEQYREPRSFQQRSVERVRSMWHDALDWLRVQTARVDLTPAWFFTIVGALLLVVTWSRNKRHVHWAVAAAMGWLSFGFGIAALLLQWPALN